MSKSHQGVIRNWKIIVRGDQYLIVGEIEHPVRKGEWTHIRTSAIHTFIYGVMVETKNSIYLLTNHVDLDSVK